MAIILDGKDIKKFLWGALHSDLFSCYQWELNCYLVLQTQFHLVGTNSLRIVAYWEFPLIQLNSPYRDELIREGKDPNDLDHWIPF